jgi:DNA-binding HxlR family transcriptional regulator
MHDAEECGHQAGACEAITHVFTLLGKRWSGIIIVTLLAGPARFSQLSRLIPGVSERMLSERLTELAVAGLVRRQVDEGPPVNVRYGLTERGEALRPALAELERWGAEQLLAPPAGEPYGSHRRI